MDDNAAPPSCNASSAYVLLLHSLTSIPPPHYLALAALGSVFFLYNFLEFHFLHDLLSRFAGLCGAASPIRLTYNSRCDLYHGVVSRCRVVHGRYLATPWLSSPHIQTVFLNFFGNPPRFSYRRQMFHASDGGTVALDWVNTSDVSGGSCSVDEPFCRDDGTPIAVVVPGLTSDSCSPYLKHLAFQTARSGWNVVVSNHRGLGGVSVTSDCFYNAGWTEDVKNVLNFLNHQYPKAPLFAIGTSIGANILVKYLGEEGENVPLAGAAAVCNPWDLLIGDRFINRKLVQKLYDRALTIGLQGYAHLHEPQYTRLADWEGIKKSRSIRDFDNYATCLVGKFETADTYYRRCSSAAYVGKVAVPLLCISALDDPVCTREAIPWDECRVNKNVVLVTPKHGGHLAFFEGITGSSLWWVRAVIEYLHVLHSSNHMHVKKVLNPSYLSESNVVRGAASVSYKHNASYGLLDHFNYVVQLQVQASFSQPVPEPSIDQGPFVNVSDGMVAAIGSEQAKGNIVEETETRKPQVTRTENPSFLRERTPDPNHKSVPDEESSPLVSTLNQLSRATETSVWLLAYIAIVTSWPWVGSALGSLFRGKSKRGPPTSSSRR